MGNRLLYVQRNEHATEVPILGNMGEINNSSYIMCCLAPANKACWVPMDNGPPNFLRINLSSQYFC